MEPERRGRTKLDEATRRGAEKLELISTGGTEERGAGRTGPSSAALGTELGPGVEVPHMVNVEPGEDGKVDIRARHDLEGLIASMEIETIVVDRNLRIVRSTPNARNHFDIAYDDVGSSLREVGHTFEYPELSSDVESVLQSGTPGERDVKDEDGRWFVARIRPYHSTERIEGTVVTFVDITKQKNLQAELEAAKRYMETLIDANPEPLLVLTEDLQVEMANRMFYEYFSLVPEAVEGRSIFEIGGPHWDVGPLRELVMDVLPSVARVVNYEVTYDFEPLGERVFLISGHYLDDVGRVILTFRDITRHKQAESELRRLNKSLEHRVKERTAQIRDLMRALRTLRQEERRKMSVILHEDIQQQLYGLRVLLDLLAEPRPKEEGEQLLDRMDDILGGAVRMIRSLSSEVNASVLETSDLEELLRSLAKRKKELYNLQVDVDVQAGMPAIETEVLLSLHHALREILFNVAKHSGTNRAHLSARYESGNLVVEVRDQGVGFDPDTPGKDVEFGGIGIGTVRERVHRMDGRLDISSKPGEGTYVRITVPTRTSRPRKRDVASLNSRG